MKNLLLIASLAFGFIGLSGCAMSSDEGEDGALNIVEQDVCANCQALHVNGLACDPTNPEVTVASCEAAKIEIGDPTVVSNVCEWRDRQSGLDRILFSSVQYNADFVLSTSGPIYTGPTNVSLATACAPVKGAALTQTYVPDQAICSSTIDVTGHPGKWVVSGNQGWCVSDMSTTVVTAVTAGTTATLSAATAVAAPAHAAN